MGLGGVVSQDGKSYVEQQQQETLTIFSKQADFDLPPLHDLVRYHLTAGLMVWIGNPVFVAYGINLSYVLGTLMYVIHLSVSLSYSHRLSVVLSIGNVGSLAEARL